MKIIEYKNFEVRPLAGALGAEILDINLNKINDEIFDEIYKAFIDYQVIGIPNQKLTSDEYLEFGRRWGKIHHYPYMKGLESHPEILEILKTETDTYAFGMFGTQMAALQKFHQKQQCFMLKNYLLPEEIHYLPICIKHMTRYLVQ